MNDGYIALTIPALTFLMALTGAVWFCHATKKFWRQTLDFHTRTRTVFRIISVVALPLLCAVAWSLFDLSEIRNGNVTFINSLVLSLFACLVVLYGCLHTIWHDIEETSQTSRLSYVNELEKAKVEREFLVNLLEGLREWIGKRDEKLKANRRHQKINNRTLTQCVSEEDPGLTIRDGIRTCFNLFKHVIKAPVGCPLNLLLLENRDGYLYHLESFNGVSWDIEQNVCAANREQYLNLRKEPLTDENQNKVYCSVAVHCAMERTIQIVDSCKKCNAKLSNSFCFAENSNEQQRQLQGSMIAIPVELTQDLTHVLCVTCSHPMAFLEEDRWKVDEVRKNLEPRFTLIRSTEDFLNTLSKEAQEAEKNVISLSKDLASLKNEQSKLEKILKAKEARNIKLTNGMETANACIVALEQKIEQITVVTKQKTQPKTPR